jgi:osmotically-inducible protein OsmY
MTLRPFRPFRTVILAACGALIAGCTLAAAPPPPDTEVDRFLLELRVRTTLLEKMGLPASDISVKATLGEVWLLGTVKRDADSATAQDITEKVEGVRSIHNDIKVVDPTKQGESKATRAAEKTAQGIEDGILQLHVKSKLVSELGRTGVHLEVEAHGGTVSIAGSAPDAARRDLALQVAGKVKGVTKVIDLMKVAE